MGENVRFTEEIPDLAKGQNGALSTKFMTILFEKRHTCKFDILFISSLFTFAIIYNFLRT